MEKIFLLLIMTLYFEIVLPKSRLDVSENFWKTRGDEFNAGQSLTTCHRNNRDQMEKYMIDIQLNYSLRLLFVQVH